MATTLIKNSMLDAGVTTAIVPIGTVLPYVLPTAPAGFLFCFGQALAPGDADDLRSVLVGAGNPFGVSGSDPRVPDLRGRAVAGKDDMGGAAAGRLTTGGAGVDGVTLGAAGGAQTHTLTVAQLPAHNHEINAAFPLIEGAGWSRGDDAGTEAKPITRGSKNTANNGSDQAHPNVQPTLVLNYIIKAKAA